MKPSRFFYSGLLLIFLNIALGAAPSSYQRAQALAEEDPREAEALYVHFIKQSGDTKVKRAAAHDLFSLRLKYGRLKEAFFQSGSSSFRQRFLSAVEEVLKLSASAARKLVAALRKECDSGPEGDAEVVGKILQKNKYPLAAYDFAVAVLTRCKIENAQAVFPDLDADAEKTDVRSLHLALMEVREALANDDIEAADELWKRVREAAGRLPEADAALVLQIAFTEARIEAKKENFSAVQESCAALEKKKPPRWIRNACRSLTTYALLREDKYADAYARIVNLKIPATDIDNRLLRLTAAVAADETAAEKLAKFIKRRSYKESAPVLRSLAETVLESKAANR